MAPFAQAIKDGPDDDDDDIVAFGGNTYGLDGGHTLGPLVSENTTQHGGLLT